jgi:hypothetical protein
MGLLIEDEMPRTGVIGLPLIGRKRCELTGPLIDAEVPRTGGTSFALTN